MWWRPASGQTWYDTAERGTDIGSSGFWQEAGDSPRAFCDSTEGPHRCQAPGAEPGRMLANREPKSVPGTRCGARSDASNQGPKSVPGTNGTVRLGSERKFSSGTWKIFVILPRALAIDDDFKNLPWLKSRTFLASSN